MSRQTKEEVLAELEWVKKVRSSIGEVDRNEDGVFLDIGEDAFEYPKHISDRFVDEVTIQSVMYSNVSHIKLNNDNSIKSKKIILSISIVDRYLTDDLFIDEVSEAIAEAMAVSLDMLIPYGSGYLTPLGLFPQNELPDGSIALSYNNQVKTIESSTGVNNAPTYNDIVSMVDTLTSIVGKDEIKKAKWYINSNTGLTLVNIRKDSNSLDDYLINPNEESLREAGIPEKMLGLDIVYNEWMQDFDKVNNVPIILGILENSYEAIIEKPLRIKKAVPNEKYDKDVDALYLTQYNIIGKPVYKDDSTFQPYVGLVIK